MSLNTTGNSYRSLKIFEPTREPLKTFKTIDDFTHFYHQHKDELDASTTHMLNKRYKIDGPMGTYRITKIKGELQLKKFIMKNTNDVSKGLPLKLDNNDDGADVRTRVDTLERELSECKRVLQELVDVINGLNH